MTGARRTAVETLGIPWPSGDWAVIRSSARQAQVLADALENAARRIGSPAPGAWEGRAASAFDATARRGRQEALEAAGSIRRTAEALLPLARAVEEAQHRAERALRVLADAEEQRRVLFGGNECTSSGVYLVPTGLRKEAERVGEEYSIARSRAERECGDAVDTVRRADRIAAAVIEQEALRAPVCIALPPMGHLDGTPRAPERPPGILESFLEGALLGDLSDNHSGGAMAGQIAAGFVPVAGQIADGRDMAAAVRDRDWHRLLLVMAAAIPGFDFFKGRKLNRLEMRLVAEATARGLDEVTLHGVEQLVKAGRLSDEGVELLVEQLVELETHRVVAIARLDRISTMEAIPQNVRAALGTARNSLRDHAKPSDLVGGMRDVAGVPVIKQENVFNHKKEVQDMMKSLEEAIERATQALPPSGAPWDRRHVATAAARRILKEMRDELKAVTGIGPAPE